MISSRLQAIASLIPLNKVVFDVGSDHALLPCYLIKNHITNKVYAGDNKEGPLKSAKENIDYYKYNDQIKTVLSDGLDKASDDVEVVVIAGMGYHTAINILNKADINKYQLIITQVNKNADLLREFISNNNYTIVSEKLVYEDFYYEIVAFNTNYHDGYSKEEILFGPKLIEENSELFKEYLNYKKDNLINILNLSNNNDPIKQDIVKSINKILNKK